MRIREICGNAAWIMGEEDMNGKQGKRIKGGKRSETSGGSAHGKEHDISFFCICHGRPPSSEDSWNSKIGICICNAENP